MKKMSTAIMLSVLVFPGAGHLYLKKTVSGLLLISLSLAALVYIISDILQRAFSVVEQIQMGNIPADSATITTMIEQQPTGEGFSIAFYGLVACWLIAIVSCYTHAKKLDNNK